MHAAGQQRGGQASRLSYARLRLALELKLQSSGSKQALQTAGPAGSFLHPRVPQAVGQKQLASRHVTSAVPRVGVHLALWQSTIELSIWDCSTRACAGLHGPLRYSLGARIQGPARPCWGKFACFTVARAGKSYLRDVQHAWLPK